MIGDAVDARDSKEKCALVTTIDDRDQMLPWVVARKNRFSNEADKLLSSLCSGRILDCRTSSPLLK